jgi:diaminopimelate epimerase
MRLRRYHGLGNDYLVLEAPGAPLHPAVVQRICDRHLGIGSDGILEPTQGRDGAHGLRIWNPDGSQAEKSGNGLRIFARWLVEHRGADPDLVVVLPRDRVRCQVLGRTGAARPVRAEMGLPTFVPADIPCSTALLDATVEVDGHTLQLTAVGLGNPHCVVLVKGELDLLPWRQLGATLEHLPLFPNRSNVQFARILAPGRVEARIWERGAGETMASGSSACAIVAAGRRLGRLDDRVAVAMPGGVLQVDDEGARGLILEGPIDEVGLVEVSAELLELLWHLPQPPLRPSPHLTQAG